MNIDLSNTIKGYHYTNPIAYFQMEENFQGLIPYHAFVRPRDQVANLPTKAYDFVTEALLEPEPNSWVKNPNFPGMWKSLMYDICRKGEVMLLSFELSSIDDAFVVERGYVERELHKTEKEFNQASYVEAIRQCWQSRIPVMQYQSDFDCPELILWSTIEFNRLNVEWIKNGKEILKQFNTK